MELVTQVETQAVTLVAEEIIINKRTLETQVVILVEILAAAVAVELTQVAERILNQELDKALVDLEMVMAQDKELDKV